MSMKKIFLAVTASLILSACSSQTVSKEASVASESSSSAETDVSETVLETESVVDVEEQVIYDENNIKVTVTGFDQDSLFVWLNVLVENNSDKDIILQTRKSNVNGYMTDFTFSCSVAAGKKANDKISMNNSDLERCGIDKITDIEFVLCITDDTFVNNSYSDTIHITRNLSEPYEQKYDDSGDVAFNDADVRIVTDGLNSDSVGSSFWFYIENNSDKPIIVQCRNTSINDFMVDGTMSCEILPGKKAVDDIYVWASQLEENNITDIETLETSFHISSDDFMETIADSNPVTITYN